MDSGGFPAETVLQLRGKKWSSGLLFRNTQVGELWRSGNLSSREVRLKSGVLLTLLYCPHDIQTFVIPDSGRVPGWVEAISPALQGRQCASDPPGLAALEDKP